MTSITRPSPKEESSGEATQAFAWISDPRFEQTLVVVTLLALIAGVIAENVSGAGWLIAALGVTAYLAGGFFGVIAAYDDLREGKVNIDLLMVLAALGAALIDAWPEGATLLFLFSLSNVLQNYAMDRSRNAIRSLLKLRPSTALLLRGSEPVEVGIETLHLGDRVLIRPGDRLPVDGKIVLGNSAIDQSSITGESIPVEKQPGDTVFAGTVNQHGALEVSVTKEASDTTLARIIRLVEDAQGSKARTQRFLDDFEQWYAIGVIGVVTLFIAVGTLVFRGSFDEVFYQGMVLLVVASPCALVISTPASILSGIASAARAGVLFKGGAHLENAAQIKVLAFDKTGTLTYGRPEVTDLIPGECADEDELLHLAASAESRSEHPLAQAVVKAAEARGLRVKAPESFQALPGRGLKARVEGIDLLIGSPRLIEETGLRLDADLNEKLSLLEQGGKTVLLIKAEDRCLGAIAVADRVREDAPEALAALRRTGIEHIVMLTGDNPRVAAAITAQAGVDEYFASLLPEDKVAQVKALQAKYGPVAMVGDGVNDAPALATASLGIAMGAAGTDVALETADVVLMSDNLARLPFLFEMSRRANRIVWQNLAFALAVIIMLILGTFAIDLPLPLGVVGHEGSTVVVVFNGLRLLAVRPH